MNVLTRIVSIVILGALTLFPLKLSAWTVDSLQHEAERGNLDAATHLSTAYRLGLGIAPNPQFAYAWAQKAAVSETGSALFCLAECLRDGLGTLPRPAEAHVLYKKALPLLRAEFAAQQVEACFNLSVCFANGLGVSIREDSSLWYLRKAAELQYAPAQLLYYRTPLIASRTERDSMEAMAILRSAADQLYEPAMTELAAIQAQRTSTEDLAYLYARRAAALGSATGAYQCGGFCYAAVGVKRDTLQSEKWFLQAASSGLLKAHAEIAYRHAHGFGLTLDAHKARRFYLQALALQTVDRPGFSNFVHGQLDSLTCSDDELQQTLREVCNEVHDILGRSGRPASYSKNALCSATRRVWRRIRVCTVDSSGEELFLACSRNGHMRRVAQWHEKISSQQDGTWTLSNDVQQLSFIAPAGITSFKVVLLSPGLLVIRDGSQLIAFERVSSTQLQQFQGFSAPANAFGEMQLRLKKSELTDQGAVRLHILAYNVPADGAVLSIDSIHFSQNSFGLNDRKQVFNFEAPDMLFEDGEVVVLVDVRGELRSSMSENQCQIELSAIYAIDDAYKQSTLHTEAINLPQQMK